MASGKMKLSRIFSLLLTALFVSLLLPLHTMALSDGEYCVSVDLSGGSGKASVTSPTPVTVIDGIAYADLTWSSANYDYMIVDGVRYDNLRIGEQYDSLRDFV